MSSFYFAGQDRAVRLREGYLDNFDSNSTSSAKIDLELYAVPVLLGICFLIGITGNGALFYTICKSKRFRNVPNSFLLNIAIVNILMLVICTPMLATSFVLRHQWPFGNVACKLVHAIPQGALAISMFSLVGLSVERYGAFAAPPKHRVNAKNRAFIGNMFIWIIGSLCGLPLAIFAFENSFYEGEDKSAGRTVICDVFNKNVWMTVYPQVHTVVSISFLFVVPIILCTIFYLSLSCVVCAKKQQESRKMEEENALKNAGRSSRSGTLTKTSTKTNTSRTIDSRTSVPTLKKAVKRRRTMAKVALILIVQFTLLWAPRWAHLIIWYFSYEHIDLKWYLINLVGLVCVYLNATITPFTVVICNRGFRHQLGKYLCCCCSCFNCYCCEKKPKHEKDDSTLSLNKYNDAERRCCPSCYGGHTEDDASSSTDRQLGDLPDDSIFNHTDQGNVYQELPEQSFYDSYTLPVKPQVTGLPAHFTPSYPHTQSPYNYHHPAADRFIPYAASYHGDEHYPLHIYNQSVPQERPHHQYREPEHTNYHPLSVPDGRYTSEPVLHAQAPKYAKIFAPHHLEQATSIREMPAM